MKQAWRLVVRLQGWLLRPPERIISALQGYRAGPGRWPPLEPLPLRKWLQHLTKLDMPPLAGHTTGGAWALAARGAGCDQGGVDEQAHTLHIYSIFIHVHMYM